MCHASERDMTSTRGAGNDVDAEHVGDEGNKDVDTSFLFIERTQELGWVCQDRVQAPGC
jgi:hypothetical protein